MRNLQERKKTAGFQSPARRRLCPQQAPAASRHPQTPSALLPNPPAAARPQIQHREPLDTVVTAFLPLQPLYPALASAWRQHRPQERGAPLPPHNTPQMGSNGAARGTGQQGPQQHPKTQGWWCRGGCTAEAGWVSVSDRLGRPRGAGGRGAGRGGGAFKNSHPILSGEETWSHSWHISSSSCHAACKTILDEEGGRLVAPQGDAGGWTGGEQWGRGTPRDPPGCPANVQPERGRRLGEGLVCSQGAAAGDSAPAGARETPEGCPCSGHCHLEPCCPGTEPPQGARPPAQHSPPQQDPMRLPPL